MTARDWLRVNGYVDFATLIDEVIAEHKAKGSKERRNWWDILAGGKDGHPMIVTGREFPVLRAAQIRQGRPITANAICRNEDEAPPDVRATGRWPRARKLTAVKRPAQKQMRQPSRKSHQIRNSRAS